jgi:hypothetical protein
MAALFLTCVIDAQKPQNGGGTNTPPAIVQSGAGDGGPQTAPSDAPVRQQQAAAAGPQGNQLEPLDTGAGPPRVVYQTALALEPAAVPAFAGEPGWTLPAFTVATPKLNALSFGGAGPGIPSPVCFTNAPGISVRTVILAARGSAADMATLIDAPETARLRTASDEWWPGLETTAAERSLTERFLPGPWQVVEADFGAAVNLARLSFGGSSGHPGWLRNWRGEIAEIVCFGAPPDGNVRAGVAHYLALRWGIAGVPPAAPAQREAAVSAGLHYGLLGSFQNRTLCSFQNRTASAVSTS